MAVITRPTITDDSGTFDNGTIFDDAFFSDIFDEIDDQVHSTTNTTIKPKATTDEVVTARGNAASLNARISGVIDADGNPIAAAGQATETQLGAAAGNINLARNSDLEDWAAGASSAPDHHTLSGTGAAIARTGTGESDTTDLGTGTYAAKITSGGAAAAKLTQAIISTAEFSAQYRAIAGKSVGFAIRAKVTNSNVLRLVIDDGVTTTASSYATGSASEQDLSVVHTLSASATKLDVYAEVALGTNVAYVGGYTVVFGLIAPTAWNPGFERFRQEILEDVVPSQADVNNLGTTTIFIGGRLSTNVTPVGNITTGEDDLMTYAVPAGLLAVDGQALRVTCWGTYGATANAKRIRAYFGSTGIEVCSVAGFSPNGGSWRTVFRIIRTAAATQIIAGEGWTRDGAGASNVFAPTDGTPGETLSGAVTLKLTGEATATDDISQKGMIVEALS